MQKPFARLVLIVIIVSSASLFAADPIDRAHQWPQWRGPDATGVAKHGDPPLTWSPDKNIAWKTPIDGKGSSTPIIWGDQIFILTAVDTKKIDDTLPKPEDQPDRPFGIKYPNTTHQFLLLSIDRATGKENWRKTCIEKVPHEGTHNDNNYASASPTTDGRRLFVWFGSAGLFCYDLAGELLWQRDLGPVNMRRSFGEGSSPVIRGERLILNRDNEDKSYIIVLDAATGATVWQKERDEISSWATPFVVEHAGRTQVIVNASNKVRSYNLENGELFWECGGQVGNVTPSPVADADRVYCLSGYSGAAAFALPLDAKGDLTDSKEIAWSLSRGTPYVPSPLLYDGLLYFNQSNDGILSCVEAATGKVVIERTRMPDIAKLYSSPVGAADRCYFTSRDGTTLVIAKAPEFKVLATNRLGEGVDASPALLGKQLFLRGEKHLFCLEEGK